MKFKYKVELDVDVEIMLDTDSANAKKRADHLLTAIFNKFEYRSMINIVNIRDFQFEYISHEIPRSNQT